MTGSAAGCRRLPAKTPPPDSDLGPTHHPHHRRLIRSPAFPIPHPKKRASVSASRRSLPNTPFLQRNFQDASRPKPTPENGKKERSPAPSMSARKLAGSMWRFLPPDDARREGVPRGFGLEPATAFANPVMERATKWEPVIAKASSEACRFSDYVKVYDSRRAVAATFVSTLYAALHQSRTRISELEDERHSSKKKMDYFLRKLVEEKASWRSREQDKVRATIDGMRDDLIKERKNQKRMEIVNSKLVSELMEVRLSVKQCLLDNEKEQKARELVEEVCNELAKEIGERKAQVEALKREYMNIRGEVEEERRMLQMAEVWREERVQMKLIDAKVMLEEKYSQLSKLNADLEVFLRARNSVISDPSELQEAEALREAVDSAKLQDVKEFSYQSPPASEDILAIFEKFQPREGTNETDTEQCCDYSPASGASKIHAVSPATDIFLEKPTTRYDNRLSGRNVDAEDDSGWETLSHDEDNGLSSSPGGSEPSVHGMYEESNALVSKTDLDEVGDNDKLNSESIEICFLTTRNLRQKSSSTLRPGHSSCPISSEKYSKVSIEAANGRMSNGNITNGTLSPDRVLGEVGLSSPSIGHWSYFDMVNDCKTRGVEECIKWRQGMQKKSLRAKLFEASMENRKLQLCHALKREN